MWIIIIRSRPPLIIKSSQSRLRRRKTSTLECAALKVPINCLLIDTWDTRGGGDDATASPHKQTHSFRRFWVKATAASISVTSKWNCAQLYIQSSSLIAKAAATVAPTKEALQRPLECSFVRSIDRRRQIHGICLWIWNLGQCMNRLLLGIRRKRQRPRETGGKADMNPCTFYKIYI